MGAALQHVPLFRSMATASATGGIGSRVLASSFAASVCWPLTVVVVTALVAWLLGRQADDRGKPAASLAGVWAGVGWAGVVGAARGDRDGSLSLTGGGHAGGGVLAVRYLFVP
jgi:hypothetical protein